MNNTNNNWEILAQDNKNKPHIDPIFGKYKSEQFIAVVTRWGLPLNKKKILKTDLREEAFGDDEVLFSLPVVGCEIYGIDISSTVVKAAAQKGPFPSLKFITADVCKLPFPDEYFDIILSNSTLDHFTAHEDFITALSELKRVLKPSGRLIITLNNKHNINFRILLKLESLLQLKDYPVQFFSMNDVRHACKEVGLAIEHVDSIIHIISPFNSIALCVRRIVPKHIADRIARMCVAFASVLGKSRWTKLFTGWFLAFACVPEQKETEL